MSFGDQVRELARKELHLQKKRETEGFVKFYKAQQAALMTHVKTEPKRDFNVCLGETALPFYYGRCLLQQFFRDGLDVHGKKSMLRQGDHGSVTVPASQWQ